MSLADDLELYKKDFFIKAENAEDDRFAPLPLLLVSDDAFSDVSDSAKIVYAVLKNRVFLSRKNSWQDEFGNAVIIFPQEEMAKITNKQVSTINRAYKELKDHFLIGVRKRGRGKAAFIYVANISKAKEMLSYVKNNMAFSLCLNDCKHSENAMLEDVKHGKNAMLCDDNIAKMQCYIIDKKTDNIKKPDNIEEITEQKKKSCPPTLDEVLAYAKEKNADKAEAEKFFYYWDSLGWKRGKTGKKIEKWKSAFSQWMLNKVRYGRSERARTKERQAGSYDADFFNKLAEKNRKRILGDEGGVNNGANGTGHN